MSNRHQSHADFVANLPLPRFHRPDDGHATPEAREAERQSIKAQLDEWLSEGNSIKQVPPGVTGFKGGRMNMVTGLRNPNGLGVSRRRKSTKAES